MILKEIERGQYIRILIDDISKVEQIFENFAYILCISKITKENGDRLFVLHVRATRSVQIDTEGLEMTFLDKEQYEKEVTNIQLFGRSYRG